MLWLQSRGSYRWVPAWLISPQLPAEQKQQLKREGKGGSRVFFLLQAKGPTPHPQNCKDLY